MKKKILLSLSSFVIVSVLIGAVSIINSSNKISSNQTNSTLQTNPENIFVASEAMASDIAIPTCNDGVEIESNELTDCFPIVNGSDSPSQEANIQLAWKRISKYKSNGTKTPVRYNPQTPATAPTPAIVPTPIVPPIVNPTPTPVVAPTAPVIPATPAITTTDIQWGAFLPNSSATDIATLETSVGASMDIRAVFVGWGNGASDFPSWLTSSIKSSGKTLLMYWEPAANGDTGNINQPGYNYDSITNGTWDSSIIAFAKAVKTYASPVILIPFDEMNGDWYPWSGTNNGNSPAKHNDAYRHLHDLFAAQGVTNVKWGWAPNNDSWPNTTANDLTMYYPGDAYVDYVGVDGFNFNNPWVSYNQIFDKAMTKLAQYNKPIYIFSMASAEANDGGAKKAAWIADTFTQIAKNPKIKGWIWFNENKEKNWLITSSTNALTAFSTSVKMY